MEQNEAPGTPSPKPKNMLQKLTKANALSKLAESDSDSDSGLLRRATGRLLSHLRRRSDDESSEGENNDEHNADEDAYERTKRRVMVSRNAAASSDGEEADNTQGAYERMKQRLMANKATVHQTQEMVQDNHQNAIPAATSSSEDDDTLPVRANRARKLLSRRERTISSRSSPAPSAMSRRSSPGLFVTPDASPVAKQSTREEPSEHAQSPTRGADFENRLKRIRAGRLEKQKLEQQRRAENALDADGDEPESDSDGENGRRLTQLAKPTRKASKKALEAMARDQQRILRNQNLRPQAVTKKRYGPKDLFAKLGFKPDTESSETSGLPTPIASSAPVTSDAEPEQSHDTPPTSPPQQAHMDVVKTEIPTVSALELPSIPPAYSGKGKGKGRAPEFQHLPPNATQRARAALQHMQATSNLATSEAMVDLSDSDDDLEVVKPSSRFPVFDRIPERKNQENTAILHQRHLAGLTSPSKMRPKGSKIANMAELRNALSLKARQQAQKERAEKLEMLRAKGIVIETEEEREKHQMEIEDIIAQFEKDREKDRKLAKREREEAKKNGETGDGLISSDESDEDFVANDEDVAEDSPMDGLSGSEQDEEVEDLEEEYDDDEEFEEDYAEGSGTGGLLDAMADEGADDEPEDSEQESMADDAEVQAVARNINTRRARNIVVDDEDEDGSVMPSNKSPTQLATQNNVMAAFGFDMAPPELGLTQAFAGTMANMETASQFVQQPVEEPEQDSIDFLRSLPTSQPNFSQANDILIPNSQTALSQPEQSQSDSMHLGISQFLEESSTPSFTQLSDVPEPTQDVGFQLSRSPAGIVPHSTVDTVLLDLPESPLVHRKGKLRRRRKENAVDLSDVDEENIFSGSDADDEVRPQSPVNAFNVLKKAAKKQKKVDDFNKKTSGAKMHVEEQASESDDEYRGIGGLSDDESGDEMDAEIREMIDTSDVKVDERQIAAYYAEKQKKEDEKRVAQIYKDLQTGAFRKRGAGEAFDLSDSEDEMEMRRRKKQREFQQRTKALLQDESVGKMAENPKQAAFFKELLDYSDDEDLDFLDQPEEPAATNSQSQSDEKEARGNELIPDSQNANVTAKVAGINPLKRKSPASDSQEKENRPPPNLRRTAAADSMIRRPISVSDIQTSVAELLDDPRVMVPDSQYLSESEDEVTVVDRQQRVIKNRLVRPSVFVGTTASTANMAFHAQSTTTTLSGFRVPSLLRRGTSTLSTASERSAPTSKAAESGIRRGGTGRSNIHAQAREAERQAMVEKAEAKRKEAMKKKIGIARGVRSVLNSLGGGFE